MQPTDEGMQSEFDVEAGINTNGEINYE